MSECTIDRSHGSFILYHGSQFIGYTTHLFLQLYEFSLHRFDLEIMCQLLIKEIIIVVDFQFDRICTTCRNTCWST